MMPQGEPSHERTPLQSEAESEESYTTPTTGNNPLTSTAAARSASTQSSFMSSDYYSTSDDDNDEEEAEDNFDWEHNARLEMRKADKLSRRLLATDNEDAQDRILRSSLRLHAPLQPTEVLGVGFLEEGMGPPAEAPPSPYLLRSFQKGPIGRFSVRNSGRFRNMLEDSLVVAQEKARRRIIAMLGVAGLCVAVVVSLTWLGIRATKPPRQPVGPYKLVERQEGADFFKYYEFYEGPDSVGSNGYNTYVSQERAKTLGIVNVTYEDDELDLMGRRRRRRRRLEEDDLPGTEDDADTAHHPSPIAEPFVYMGSAATPAGPRESIRLEGIRRFNRGLFILDVRHMPNGCGVWPAFWLTDEANWPVNGEIDIVEGVNYQSRAKTALHSTQGCDMFDIPLGTMTGGWDTAQGIPDVDTGIPDMTMRYARNCFVYDQHQWLNQGCVAVDLEGGTIGGPLNAKGGGTYVLEWDPINRHIRSWVFTPHESMPDNLIDTIKTAHLPPEKRVAPNPELWPLPYGYFSIGVGTNCPSDHFQRMRIVFNTAFCGSVAGNRYFMDCPKQFKQFKTCNEWIGSNPEEMAEAYWKIRGVYVYEREWEQKMLN